MPKVLVAYDSHGGNTRKLAEALARTLEAEGCSVSLEKIAEGTVDKLKDVDGVLLGSPCYFGNMSATAKSFLDQSIKFFGAGELVGKPAGVFCSTGGIGGMGELALLSLLTGLLIHGMVAQGLRKGGHVGPLAIGEPDERVLGECEVYAKQFAALVKKLAA
ncbi:MAG: flavodoxin family protein [Deltaproteobacteria bacterium]|nr:flavodoxin family protein [Deltaproteobacteria bacterium]